VEQLAGAVETGAGALDAVRGALGDHTIPPAHAAPLLDLDRARRRLGEQATALRTFLVEDPSRCRWLELARERGDTPRAAICSAPVDVAAALAEVLWKPIPAAVATSATISVAGDFGFWRERHGLQQCDEAVFPSPFDHFRMALLGVPTDLVPPDDPRYDQLTARAVIDAIRASGGGAFVLCTSFRAVQLYATACRSALPVSIPVLAQGEASRPLLLDRFREHRNAVLVGADSFWEGVSVKGDGLRLVIVPRLPFRVPTEPLQQARHERIVDQGGDAFRALSLPQAVLRMRQGYGRLIRSTEDRGVVLLLDRRILDKSYGRIVLAALPPARRLVAPMHRILSEMSRFYAERPVVGPRVDPDEKEAL
jgi:ATP-dependent DNA helicase DinG